jgi:hypothetical protein
MIIDSEAEILGGNPAPVSTCPPEIPRDRTRAGAVGEVYDATADNDEENNM